MRTTTREERAAMSIEGINAAVLAGTLSSDPRELELESGSRLLRLEVTTRTDDDERADSVPVAWFDPPASAPVLASGDQVIVIGKVRRRWFGGPGGSRSATEVVAATVVPRSRRAAARKALDAAVAGIHDAATG
jgi:single-strand DNA-binding protein